MHQALSRISGFDIGVLAERAFDLVGYNNRLKPLDLLL